MTIVSERDAKQRVLTLVSQVKSELELQSPPQYKGIDDPIAKYLKIKIKEHGGLYGDGMYIPGDPPTIIVDPTKSDQERLNFTFFHEISHHLIRMDGELYGFLDDHSPRDLHPTLERYCDMGAAEFLIPEAEVRKIIGEQGFSITLIRDLDAKFLASKPAIAIQLAQCASHQCIMVVCEYGVMPQKSQAQTNLIDETEKVQPQLFVRYSSSSPSCKYKTGRLVPIPQSHLIANSYEQRASLKGRENIPVLSGKIWPNDCETFFYKDKVYAVFNLTDPPSRNQIAFNF